MKKRIQITESELKNIILESINEMSPQLLHNTSNRAGYLNNYEEVKKALRTIEHALYAYRDGGYWSDKMGERGAGYPNQSPIYNKAENAFETLRKFFERKYKQAGNLLSGWDKMDDELTKGMTNYEKDDFHDSLYTDSTAPDTNYQYYLDK